MATPDIGWLQELRCGGVCVAWLAPRLPIDAACHVEPMLETGDCYEHEILRLPMTKAVKTLC